jgi:cold shock CspA family protein
MFIGVVISYQAGRGYGFLKVENGNGSDPHCFFHVSELRRATGQETIAVGTRVAFDIGSFKGRENAINLRVLDDEANDDEGNLQSEYIKSLD